uniref:Uncharacterized protein n=1 Tax=Coccolithus braarudii TaxID=221442 RepID=A0A7S0LB73_9EUKA
MSSRLCMLMLVTAHAWKLPVASRRAVLSGIAPLLAATPFAAHAIKETGYAANSAKLADASAVSRFADTPLGEPAGVRIGGSYADPNHPGCKRKVTLAGSAAIIDGADEDGNKWRVRGEARGKYLLVDFTPKGGPAGVLVEWNGLGLVFPDGNVWIKK